MFDLNLGRIGLNPRPDYRPGQQAAPLDLVSFGGSLWVCTAPTTDAPAENHAAWMPAAKGGLMRLTSDLTIYVREDGDDSNSGLEDSPEGAFKTPQAAIRHVVRTYDLDMHTLTVRIGPGTFPGFTCFPYAVLSGRLVVEGSGSQTLIQAVNANGVYLMPNTGFFTLRNLNVHMRLTRANTATRNGFICNDGCRVEMHDVHIRVDQETAASAYIYGISCRGGRIDLKDNISFEMNPPADNNTPRLCALQAQDGGILSMNEDIAVTGAVYASLRLICAGMFIRNAGAFIGSFSAGRRYSILTNSFCYANGGGEEFFPGTAAGVLQSGGQYIT